LLGGRLKGTTLFAPGTGGAIGKGETNCPGGKGAIDIIYIIKNNAVEKAGLSAKGISTHSTRRSFITKLHRNGTDLYTIKKITGHKDFKALERYVEIDSDRVKGAIAAL
jgi:integrase